MSYCINPWCKQRQNSIEDQKCQVCGTPLVIKERFRLLKPMRPPNLYSHTEVFEVIDETGTGYQGQWVIEPGTHRIMKVLSSKSSKLVELIQREASMLQALVHSGIPRVFRDDYFIFTHTETDLELHCLVQQKFEGQNLEAWLKTHGCISQSRAFNWLKQLADILNHVHQAGYFHRDIKPANIIYQPSGELALIDFGGGRRVTETYLAKVSGAQNTTGTSKPTDVTVVMTAGYAPPEQFDAKALPQSDFFALGRTFVHLLTGIHPLNLPTDEETGQLIWKNKAADLEKPFIKFIDDLIAIAPGKRPQNTQVLLQRLENLPLELKFYRVRRSKPFRIGIAGAVCLAALGACKILPTWGANLFYRQGSKALLEENNPDVALNDFQLAATFDSKISSLISGLYFQQAQTKRFDAPEIAKKYYELAIKFKPNFPDAYSNLGLVCQTLNDDSCVNSSYNQAFKQKPHFWQAHFGLGSYYDDRGDFVAAEKQYLLATERDGKIVAEALNNLSRLNILQGKYKSAVNFTLQGIERTSNSEVQATLFKNLGWAELKQGYYIEAEKVLLKAQELDPTITGSYCLLAQVNEAQHQKHKAAAYWKICLRMNSSSPEEERWKEEALARFFKS